jgi:tetratricopeptide (TPR) repeat protein
MKIDWIEKHMTEAEKMIVDGDQLELGLAILYNLLYEEPGYGRLHNHLGWAHLYHTEDLDRAELHLKAAIKFDAENDAAYIHLGNLYIQKEKFKEAIGILDKGAGQPLANKARMLELKGQCYERLKKYRRAGKAYKNAMLESADTFQTRVISLSIERCEMKRKI